MGQYPAAGLPAQVIALPFRLLPWLPENRSRNLSEDVRKVSRDAMISAYNRRDELEADAYGSFYAYQAGYDLDQGIYLWERLAAAVDRNVFADTYFLDSHPAAPERLARLKQIAQLYKAGKAAQVLVPEN
jgi:predicted Zn-dependent protease